MTLSDEPLFKNGENWHALNSLEVLNRLHHLNELDSSTVKPIVRTFPKRPSLTLDFGGYRLSGLDGEDFFGFSITYVICTLLLLVAGAGRELFSVTSLMFLLFALIILAILKFIAFLSFKRRFVSGFVRHVVHCFNDDALPFFVDSADLIKPDSRRFALSQYREILISGAVETLFFERRINWPLCKIIDVVQISLDALNIRHVGFSCIDGSRIQDRILDFLSTIVSSDISHKEYERLSSDLYKLTLQILKRDTDNDLKFYFS